MNQATEWQYDDGVLGLHLKHDEEGAYFYLGFHDDDRPIYTARIDSRQVWGLMQVANQMAEMFGERE